MKPVSSHQDPERKFVCYKCSLTSSGRHRCHSAPWEPACNCPQCYPGGRNYNLERLRAELALGGHSKKEIQSMLVFYKEKWRI